MPKNSEIISSVIWGYGFQFAPERIQDISRRDMKVKKGALRGVLLVKPEDSGVRTVNASRYRMPEEKIYDIGETPSAVDISNLLNALMMQHPLGEERLLRRLQKIITSRDNGEPISITVTELAPPFYYTTHKEMPEQTAKEPETPTTPDNTEATLTQLKSTPPVPFRASVRANLLAKQLRGSAI